MNLAIQTSYPEETMEVRQELLDASPYLSDTVMVAAVEKEEVLPNAMVRDVLVENPQAAKSEKVQNALDNRTEEMPQYMRNQIDQGMDTLSEKELLEAKLAYHKMKQAWAFNKLHYLYRTDTTVENVSDSLTLLYTNDGSLNNKYRLAMLHLKNGDTTIPFIILTDIGNNFELTDNQEDERQAYDTYFGITKRMVREGFQYPDSTSIAGLEGLEQDNHGKPAIYARNILVALNEITYQETVLLPDTSLKTSEITDPSLITLDYGSKPTYLKLKPNPASDYVIAEWQLPESIDEAMLHIRDIDGRLIKSLDLSGFRNEQVISTANWKPGTYVISLVSGNVKYESRKLSIIK